VRSGAVVDADEREIILHPGVDVDEHGVMADGERAHLIVEARNQPSPDVSEHDDVTGARPLAVVGTPKLTGTSLPSTDVASAGAGHVTARTPPAEGAGAIGDASRRGGHHQRDGEPREASKEPFLHKGKQLF
jgi:hypothetical protein